MIASVLAGFALSAVFVRFYVRRVLLALKRRE
jgi:hypothetical protein